MAINAINGIAVDTGSTINGVSGLGEVNGIFLESGGGGVVASDDFQSYADYASLDAQANWTNVSADQIYVYPAPNKSAGAGVSASVRGIRHTATVAANHYASGTLGVTGSVAVCAAGPAVRMQSGADSFYCLQYFRSSSELILVKMIAGTSTSIGSPVAKVYVTGNGLRLEATGAGSATRLTAYEDVGGGWVAIGAITSVDPGDYLDDGFSGLAGWASVGLDPEVVLVDWECGDL